MKTTTLILLSLIFAATIGTMLAKVYPGSGAPAPLPVPLAPVEQASEEQNHKKHHHKKHQHNSQGSDSEKAAAATPAIAASKKACDDAIASGATPATIATACSTY